MKCSKCNSTNCKKFCDEPKQVGEGHREYIQCLDCGHTDSWYVASMLEKLNTNNSYHYVEHYEEKANVGL